MKCKSTNSNTQYARSQCHHSRVRSRWCSNEYTWPVGATARASECVREPDPVPDSSTTAPGLSSRYMQMTEMSAECRVSAQALVWASECVRQSNDPVPDPDITAPGLSSRGMQMTEMSAECQQ